MSPHRLIPPDHPARPFAELAGHIARRLGTAGAAASVSYLVAIGVPHDKAEGLALGVVALLGVLVDLWVSRLMRERAKKEV